ncbi:cation-transporting P-type ATPase, partial [Halomonas campaniensis]|uniref:cation-transporting P-type ATPase n=1 Tax=Halomonas campaniensis TaxID=213554 RepID=UPI0035615A99
MLYGSYLSSSPLTCAGGVRMTAPRHSEPTAWHALGEEESLDRLESTRDGLDGEEARRRLAEHGPNQLQQAEARPW